jgi:hypothetical protein
LDRGTVPKNDQEKIYEELKEAIENGKGLKKYQTGFEGCKFHPKKMKIIDFL